MCSETRPNAKPENVSGNAMKTLIPIFFIFFNFAFLKGQNNDELCKYIADDLKEKPLPCLDKSKIRLNEEIYQIYKWSAFREDYLIRIEKNKNNYFLVEKKMTKHHYNQETGEEIQAKVETILQRKLNQKEYLKFENIINESKLWQNSNYFVKPICTDGGGIIIYAIKKDNYIRLDNANCSPKEEYLNKIYLKIKELFNL